MGIEKISGFEPESEQGKEEIMESFFDTSELDKIDVSGFDDLPAETETESEAVDDEQTEVAAAVTASMTAGALATGIEFLFKPVKIDDETRTTFADRLAAVLEKNDGALPPWLARLIAEWEEERKLAMFLVITGWEIKNQYRAAKLAEAEAERQKDSKMRVRVNAVMGEPVADNAD